MRSGAASSVLLEFRWLTSPSNRWRQYVSHRAHNGQAEVILSVHLHTCRQLDYREATVVTRVTRTVDPTGHACATRAPPWSSRPPQPGGGHRWAPVVVASDACRRSIRIPCIPLACVTVLRMDCRCSTSAAATLRLPSLPPAASACDRCRPNGRLPRRSLSTAHTTTSEHQQLPSQYVPALCLTRPRLTAPDSLCQWCLSPLPGVGCSSARRAITCC